MSLKLILIALSIFTIHAFGQKHEFVDLNKSKLKQLNQNPVLLLSMDENNEFRLPQVKGDFAVQKKKLKSYILVKKSKANIQINKKLHKGFEVFQTCFNQVNSIYQEIWNEIALERHHKNFEELETKQKEAIVLEYPVRFK